MKFKLDYSGNEAAGFKGSCRRYDGPALSYLVAACKAPDGSYWAVQEWPQPLPDLGYTPWLPAQRALWMDVSHWRGPLPRLQAYPDWTYNGKFHSLFGRFTYRGKPVYAFATSRRGAPRGGFGRLIFLDTYGSAYGPGWRRENSFVPHKPTGVFCYGFYSFDPTRGGYAHPRGQTDPRGPGNGMKYRLLARGPGVTPDVQALVKDPGDYDQETDAAFRLKEWRILNGFVGSDQQCRHGRALGGVGLSATQSWFSSAANGPSIGSFTLGAPLFFNVRFSEPANASGGTLPSAVVKWTGPNGGNRNVTTRESDTVSLSADGLIGSAPFGLTQVNRRFVGTWTAKLVVGGLAVAQATVQAHLPAGTIVVLSFPTISGSPVVGSTLTADPGTWLGSPTSFEYRWLRCTPPTNGGYSCYGISGASGATYRLTSADVGSTISVQVTAVNSFGRSRPVSPLSLTAVVGSG